MDLWPDYNALLHLFVASALVLAAASFYAFMLFRKRTDPYEELMSTVQHILSLHQDSLDALSRKYDNLNTNLDNLGQQLNTVKQEAQLPSPATNQSRPQGYRQAIKMLEMGVALDEMMEACGLSRAEAEFLASLYSYKQAIS